MSPGGSSPGTGWGEEGFQARTVEEGGSPRPPRVHKSQDMLLCASRGPLRNLELFSSMHVWGGSHVWHGCAGHSCS